MKKSQLIFSMIKKMICLYSVMISSGICSSLHTNETDGDFSFELTPYLWAASIKGTTATDGEESPPVDSGYNFFSMDNLDGVASATFTVRKNQWGFLFDYLFVAYEDTFLQATPLQTTTRLEGAVIEFTGAYDPVSTDNLTVIAGLRHQDIRVSLALLNHNPEQSVSWVDPFAGLIYACPLNGNFRIVLRGDLGGFGFESKRAVNAEAMIRYQFGDTFAVKFGYRYLKVTFEENTFLYDLSLDGFLLGFGIRF